MESNKERDSTLEKASIRVMMKEPFWGVFMIGIEKYFSDETRTLAVVSYNKRIAIEINREFWDSLEDYHQVSVLVHELHHIAFGHILMAKDFSNKRLFNIAADLEVNSYIHSLPPGALSPRQFGFEDRQGTKTYYDKLNQLNRKRRQSEDKDKTNKENLLEEGKTLDDHSNWDSFSNLSTTERTILQTTIQEKLANTISHCKGIGTKVPASIQEYVNNNKNKRTRTKSWKEILRNTVLSSLDSNLRSTRKRVSKRFEDSKGVRLKKKATLLVALDTSMSISNKNLEEFSNELHYLYNMNIKIDIIYFDTRLYDRFSYKGEKKLSVKGRGGTSFDEPLQYFSEHLMEYNLFAMFTDGYANIPKLNFNPRNLLWILTSDSSNQKYPGRTLTITN